MPGSRCHDSGFSMPELSKEMSAFSGDDIGRFWSKVAKRGPSECWEWTASRNAGGYGLFRHAGRTLHSNRVAWVLAGQPDPAATSDGLLVCHSCNNSRCCNPGHLHLDTHAGNQRFKLQSGRQKGGVGERNSHAKLTAEHVVAIRRSDKTTVALAADYGISQTSISKIQLGLTWRRVGGPIRGPRPKFGG